ITDRAKECLKTGGLIPTEDFISIVLPHLSSTEFANRPLFLSSFGRWHGEEASVISALEKSNHPLKAVVYLDISNADSMERWQNRLFSNDRNDRADDTVEILQTRFKEFDEKTMPVIDFYRPKNLLIEIDGTKSREQVEQNIVQKLYEKSTN
ncbi:MAG: nucleoside monophosphate kinase, partial [Pseudomonadota bacterium]